jgi:hypothetical protein
MSALQGTVGNLLLYIALVAAGAIVGGRVRWSEKGTFWLSKLQFVSLMILIVTLGVKLGADDQVIASLGYYLPVKVKGLTWGTHLNLFYRAYSNSSTSFMYQNDMNGDNLANDLIYIPANDNEIQFKTEEDRAAFWKFVEQDDYLRTHKGEYAEAYMGRSPWNHSIDLRLAEDFSFRVGKTIQKFQASVDVINFGNLLNSHWGVPKINTACAGRILKYEGRDAMNRPVYSVPKFAGSYPTQTYESSMSYGNCWSLQIGLKYFFN